MYLYVFTIGWVGGGDGVYEEKSLYIYITPPNKNIGIETQDKLKNQIMSITKQTCWVKLKPTHGFINFPSTQALDIATPLLNRKKLVVDGINFEITRDRKQHS